MPISLVVCDLDGTLVRSDLTVSQRVQGAIRRLQEETYVRVVLATGRMFPSAVRFAHELNIANPIITYQGAMIRQVNGLQSMLHHQAIALNVAKGVLAICRRLGLHLNVYINDKLYVEPHPYYVELYRQTASIEPNVVPSMEQTLLLPPTKLVIIEDDQDKMREAHEALEATFGDSDLFKCQSRHHFLEITAPGITKWRAVRELADVWSIPTEQILCIGDQDNDLSMIKEAGLGIAMGNAPDFVKEQADVVVSSIEEDGAAEAIERYALEPALQRQEEARRLGKPPSLAGVV